MSCLRLGTWQTANIAAVVFAVLAGSLFASAACNDDRDKMIKEYVDQTIDFTPACGDFTSDGHSTHFTFAELNTGDFSAWAILRGSLLSGIETTRTKNGNASLTVNSAYRNPKHNSGVEGAAKNSRHLHGDAIDFQSDEDSWGGLRQAGKDASACAEPQALSGTGHVHLDWRGTCPANW